MQSEESSSSFDVYFALARRYCGFYEVKSVEDQRQFLSLIQRFLLDLYTLGRELPEIHPSENEFEYSIERDDKQIQSMIAFKLPFSSYWQALDPFSIDESELGLGDLVDDLGHIYKELKTAILIYDSQQDGATRNAYWKLKFDFDYHLADHCMNAIKAIHDYQGKDGYNGW